MAKKKNTVSYKILQDQREKLPWDFSNDSSCKGTEIKLLETGDYTLEGYEKHFTIERKGNTGEWAGNLFQDRFEAELERMKEFKHAFIILEFTMADIVCFPENSGIPRHRWGILRTTNWLMLKRTLELMMKYPNIHFIFAGIDGKSVAISIFKRIIEQCQEPEKA